ncbi:hypothetical protein COT75_04270 [Candidatus Beckwithbacteria bacterium CG10_big_fil_rev_8_21_14_0_10_34_10]|uniref:Uncharacterized protein n=1 Tax=Candidatus Beckwithbacteria bacterium CG10_big_fil_rev_8_21_14_0_10_34_10 TaxID=1974495 RepID=A0A2H0W886_9BACT|nr:MAG: hypothetical protein COT75_04270 [Candidatus Beckwithbacteria bacterium CG10_big_fil_rev_8_21_14_0_10_34_10]
MKKIIIKFFLAYLKVGAKIQLLKIKPKIIALTGSAGKTSLRNAIEAVLKDDFKVKKSIKANSETGIPLDILDLHLKDYSYLDWLRVFLLVPIMLLFNWKQYDYYIVELGIDEPYWPKNMKYLLSFIKPDLSIFLNVLAVHTQQFEKAIPENKKFSSSFEKQNSLLNLIAQEKGKILTQLNKGKIGLANADDLLVLKEAQKSKAKIFYFGKKASLNFNNLKIIKTSHSLKGTEFTFQHLKKIYHLKLNFLLPSYYVTTLAAAIQTGLVLGLSFEKALTNLKKNFSLPLGRMSVFKGLKKTLIIDSSYNASKKAVLGALELLKNLKTKANKVFVFGDMRELGSQTKKEHEAVAEKILEFVDLLVCVGPETKKYVYPKTKAKIKSFCFKNSFQAGDWLLENLQGGEVILVKGSQNTIFLEVVVEKLLENKKDIKKLCRQSKYWDKKRKELI